MTAALIVASIASLHADGRLLEEIAERVGRGRWLAEGVEPAAVAFECVSAYRGNGMPGTEWWDADLYFLSLLESWADRGFKVVGSSETETVLRDRWLLGPEVADSLAGGLGEPEIAPMDKIDQLVKTSPEVVELLELEPTTNEMAMAAGAVPEVAAPAHGSVRDLASAISFFHQVRKAEQAADQAGYGDIAEKLDEAARLLETSLRSSLMCLSTLEGKLLSPVTPADRTLKRALEETKRRHLMVMLNSSLGMLNGIADRFGQATLVPDWLEKQIFAAGARSGTFGFGPTAYLWIALERHELPPDREVRMLSLGLLPQDGRHLVELRLGVGEGEDTLYMDYGLGNSDASRRWLAMLVLSKKVMVDVFEIAPNDEICLLQRASSDVERISREIESRVVEAVEREGLAPVLTGQEYEGHVLGGFAASENAKSEMLVTLSTDIEDEEVRQARQALLDAHVSRAWTLYGNGDPRKDEDRVEAAMRRYAEARSRAPRPEPLRWSEDPEAAHRELVGPFTEGDRAVVHFNFGNSHLEGFWTGNGGEERGWLECGSVGLPSLIEAIEPWLEGGGDINALVEAAAPLAEEIDAGVAEAEIEVKEILIVPWSLLHGVPFGALPLDGGVLGDRYSITYAPSLAILQPLLTQGDAAAGGIELIAAHGGTLAWADAEIRAAQFLHPAANVTPDGSPHEEVVKVLQRGRLVHLASHGKWWRGDHFASHLDLRLPGLFDRRISAAEIHRDFDLQGTELVILSACDTGRSPSLRRGIESYMGLDAAFLARGGRAVVSTLWPIDDLGAMIFTTSLHAKLVAGESLSSAFAESVALLRSGLVHKLPGDDPVSQALDTAEASWRSAASDRAALLSSPKVWAAFKLSGVPWLSRPFG